MSLSIADIIESEGLNTEEVIGVAPEDPPKKPPKKPKKLRSRKISRSKIQVQNPNICPRCKGSIVLMPTMLGLVWGCPRCGWSN